ncbi:MAG: peptidylprolyl isomerase [Crocinitomicaceae bacterium]|nr:peptidylprolyl isomerase [Crocinitomicaceae bacterium]MDG1777108.1 peptidylprolyl isomerase [Crocinitomicaceae bacterium]
MNKLLLIALTLTLSLSSFAQDPVIMTINDQEITKSEFLQIYLKNNNDPQYDKVSLDEYMELFKKFKLKVAEAEALGYDTIPKLVKELGGYRKQLALPYLIDSAKNESLIKEAYLRTKEEVRVSHILIKVSEKASPADTLAAYNRIMRLKDRINDGLSFKDVAQGKGGSEDPSVAKNGGDLNFFSAFQMVYPFEEKAYTTELDKVSDPFRTRFGYHILQVTDKRPARGTIETAHIMVAAKISASQDEVENATAKINEIYELLENGGNFEELVAKYSDDPSSNKKNGVLPPFGTGTTTRMVTEFEEAAFTLKNDGEYSKPIRTNYGFHIVKRLKLTNLASYETMKKTLKSKVAKDERSKTTQDSFVAKLKKEYNFKSYSEKGLKWFYKNLDSTYSKGQFDPSTLSKNKTLFKIDNKKFYQQDFAQYLKSNYRGAIISTDGSLSNVVDAKYSKWEKEAILNYEESKLATKYPAFKALITEYHDGILLYEIMSDIVWNKAMKDTTGLKTYYNNNKSDYFWGTRINGDVYECYTLASANKVYDLLKTDTLSPVQVVQLINGESELNIRHRNGKFDLNKTQHLSSRELNDGLNSVYELDGKYYIVVVSETLEPAQKEFSEAKGAITSNYQNFLEKNWLDELNKKHSIKVNTQELYSIGK